MADEHESTEAAWLTPPEQVSVVPQPIAALDMMEVARQRASIEVYERELLASVDPRRRAALAHEIGRIHEDVFGDEREAIRHYQRAYRYDPTHRPTLSAVRRLFGRAGHWGMAARLVDAELKATTEPRDRARLCCEKGELNLQQFGRPDVALRAFQAAVALQPDAPRALLGLAQAAALEGAPDLALTCLERLAEEGGASAPALRLEAALTLGDRDPVRVLALLAGPDGGGQAGQTGWATFARRVRTADGVAGALAAARAVGVSPPLEACLSEELTWRTPPALGAAWADAAVAQAPDSGDGWLRVADAAAAAGEGARAAAALARAAALAGNDEARAERLWRLADLQLMELGDADGEADTLERLLEVAPQWMPAYTRLERLLVGQADWRRLAEVGTRRLNSPKVRATAADWLRLGWLWWRRLDALPQAIDAFKSAHQRDPELIEASAALIACLEAVGDWAGVAALEESEGERATDLDTRLMHLSRAVEVLAERLSDAEGASRVCRRILQRTPEHLPTLRRLRGLTLALERYPSALFLIEQEIDLITDRARTVVLLLHAAEIADQQLGESERAVAYLERALALAPMHEPVFDGLYEVHRRAGSWSAMAALYRRQVALTADTPTRANLLYQLGQLLRDRLNDTAGAVEAFEAAVAIGEAAPGAAASLRGWYRSRGDHVHEAALLQAGARDGVAADLIRLAALEAGPLADPERARIHFHAASVRAPQRREAWLGSLALAEAEGDLEGALSARRGLVAQASSAAEAALHQAEIARLCGADPQRRAEARAACEAVVAHAPDEVWAWLMLERLALSAEDLAALPRIHDGLAAAFDGALAVEMKARLGRLRAGPLDEPEAALADFRAVLALDPDHVEALEHLERVAARTGDVNALAGVLARRLAVASNDREQVMVLQRAGDALWRAGRLPDAVRCFEAVRALDAESIVALRSLRALYAQLGEDDAAVRLTEVEGHTAHDPRNAVALLLEAGSQREASVRDPGAALDDYRAALDRDPHDDEVLDRVRRLCARSGRYGVLAEVLEAVASRRGVAGQALRLEAVELRARRLNDIPGAVKLLVAVAAERRDVSLWQRAGDLAVEDESWDQAVAAYGEVFAHAADPGLRAAVALRVAAIHRDKRREVAEACVWLQGTLAQLDEPRLARRYAELAQEVADAARHDPLATPDLREARRAAALAAWRVVLGDPEPAEALSPIQAEAALHLAEAETDDEAAWRWIERTAQADVDPERRWAVALQHLTPATANGRLLPLMEAVAERVGGARAKAVRRHGVEAWLGVGGAAAAVLPTIEVLLGADPDDEALRRLHIDALVGQGQPERLLAAHRWILSRHPFDTEALRGVRRASLRMDQGDRACEISRLLVGIDSARVEDRQVIESWQGRTHRWPARGLDRVDRRLVWGGGVEANLAAVLGRLGAHLPDLAPAVEPEAGTPSEPLVELARRIGALVGCPVANLRFGVLPLDGVRARGDEVWISPGLAELAEAEQSFVLATGLELAARSLDWLLAWSEAEVPRVLSVLGRLGAPDAADLWRPTVATGDPGGQTEPAFEAALAAVVQPHLDEVGDDLATLAAILPQTDSTLMVGRLRHPARRVGLLMCGGVLPAVRALRRVAAVEGEPAPAEQTPGLPELVRWLLGDPYYALRGRLGLAPATEP